MLWATAGSADPQQTISYPGMCDASAAVAINDKLFVVANDEDNVLRVYRRGEPGAPQQTDLSRFLEVSAEHQEADIEGAARVGDTIYWIGSHGQNSKGKKRPNRHRFFATKVTINGGKVDLKPEGQPYKELRSDLIDAPELQKYGLREAATLAPEDDGGFNIEGLAAKPDGTMLIGFRNPLYRGKSIVVPLINPEEVINGRKAKFGSPSELDLGRRGIRSIEYSEARKLYLIVAGPADGAGSFALFTWSGTGDHVDHVPDVSFSGLRPESMFVYPGEPKAIEFLSDDGDDCEATVSAVRQFRSFSRDVP
jgi:hypothetical protein